MMLARKPLRDLRGHLRQINGKAFCDQGNSKGEIVSLVRNRMGVSSVLSG